MSPIEGTLQILGYPTALIPRHASWQPIIGETTFAHLGRTGLDSSEEGRLRSASVDILSRCLPPSEQGARTGLVMGSVQSGKTLSFTTVAALAADNGFRTVIVLTGTTGNLLDQTRLRLESSLPSTDAAHWVHLSATAVRSSFEISEAEGVVVLTAMKNPSQIQRLVALFTAAGMDSDSVLVIDDEADQASLNTQVKKGSESTTYRSISELRSVLPSHTYLQYTATPQAPLLLELADSLSPDFVAVLTPGNGYVGGRDLFSSSRQHLHLVPDTDSLGVTDPKSLKQAFQVYLLGAAASRQKLGPVRRSMLVHPSRTTPEHGVYAQLLQDLLLNWKTMLSLPALRPFLEVELQDSYSLLARTYKGLPSLADLIPLFASLLDEVCIQQVNAADGPSKVEWGKSLLWVLVGGQMLDRGFTVEGLTVTYMPRSLGVGNADTLQQRGRFFGYKRSYLQECHLWLLPEVEDAFRAYAAHEENLRSQMFGVSLSASPRPLTTWKRTFLLDPALKPTRSSVLSAPGLYSNLSDQWYRQTDVLTNVETNNSLVEALLSSADPRGKDASGRHSVFCLSAEELFDRFLLMYSSGEDSTQRYAALLCQLASCQDDGLLTNTSAVVYQMDSGSSRMRTPSTNGFVTLQQGRNPSDTTGYQGDAAVYTPGQLSLQVSTLTVQAPEGPAINNVPAIALWVPTSLGRSVYVQGRR